MMTSVSYGDNKETPLICTNHVWSNHSGTRDIIRNHENTIDCFQNSWYSMVLGMQKLKLARQSDFFMASEFLVFFFFLFFFFEESSVGNLKENLGLPTNTILYDIIILYIQYLGLYLVYSSC